jgi:hypothetical protein
MLRKTTIMTPAKGAACRGTSMYCLQLLTRYKLQKPGWSLTSTLFQSRMIPMATKSALGFSIRVYDIPNVDL